MNGVVASIVVVALSAFVLFALRDDAMETCQKTHSYDVCFQELNR